MAEPLGDIEGRSRLVIEFNGVPLTECRRTNPNIDDHIEDPTGEALHVLRLTGRDEREMNAAHGADPRDRDVHLLQVELVTDGLGQH